MLSRTKAFVATVASSLILGGAIGADALTADFTEIQPPPSAVSMLGADINDSGQVAGTYWDTGPRAFLRDADGTYAELAGPTGFSDRTSAVALNARGDVVGSGEADATSSSTAVWWPAHAGPPVDLGALPGHDRSFAVDINDSGLIVGWSNSSFGPSSAWLHDPDSGVLLDLGLPPGTIGAQPTAINDAGVVTGRLERAGLLDIGFLWTEAAGMVVMPVPPWAPSFNPVDINEAGQVVGRAQLMSFVWDPSSGFTKLSRVGDDWGYPESINDDGLVVGWAGGYNSELDADLYRPAAWDPITHKATELPQLPGTTSGQLAAVNNHGVAVGNSAFTRTFVGQIGPDPVPEAPSPAAAEPVPAAPTFTG